MQVSIQPLTATPRKSEKLFYIDNIRVVLTLLVILHHAFITYGASGGWYYKEATSRMEALIPMTIFVSVNQSFFMGFFFLLAGFFTYSSFHRKGLRQFITERLVRLGIPLLFYSFVFSPFLSFLIYRYGKRHRVSYLQYLSGFDNWVDFGVLWFVAALLLFTLIYVFGRKVLSTCTQESLSVPGTKTILLTALLIGLTSFIVRIMFPVGWVLKPLGFQLGHFTQYLTLFVAGLLAAKNNWLEKLSYRTGKQVFSIALLLLLFFPLFYLIRIKLHMPVEWYSGGFNGLSLLYAVWEQCIGLAIITAFLAIGKRHWNAASLMLRYFSRHAFAVYIFHPLTLIALSLTFRSWTVDPAIKLLFVAPLGLICSFLLATLILLLPGVKRII
ncbi:acyltransferase family protein [Mucilaginibacter sp. Bleaf8]|uniref:acyltransferase family protein n=1 Tax=Mucilaginibacter sp. Bleaf8 TaxID=2834430 RepID=UPI001BCABE8F|nr:acyltransferase family protein [Mucilaginibacter sp. Bleaf8]MBS7566849.1 acyltransferase family protein [Mucilaginibacter sp. Bleaf8]